MKTLFVWTYLDTVSLAYHSSGGLLIIADDLSAATKLAEVGTVSPSCITPAPKQVIFIDRAPDLTLPVASEKDILLVFRDAGCC